MVARHKDAVYRQIARVCGNYDDTEDVLVETFLAAYRAMDQVRDPEAMRGWLATIGRRICRRMKSKEALAPILQLADEIEPSVTPNFEEIIEEGRMRDCVVKALKLLPENYREAYVLRDLEGLSAEEAAKKLGINIRNLKSRLHRARSRIRESLDSGLCGTI
ncbi:MAG TPA: RNA polymerase sigma factor [Fimbriimonadaceae bacterium]|nr:RNA polymerase sigma factor [Fimbriimonadaceae bacterium]